MNRLLGHPLAVPLVALLLVLGLAVGLVDVPLWDQDEAAYAGFAGQMLRTGDFALPAFPWSEVHRKPPLHFWLMAGAFSVLGEGQLATRLHTAAAVALSVGLTWRWGRHLVGEGAARAGALILATSCFVAFGKIALTDGLLLLCQTVAALALLRGLARPSWRMAVALWLAVAAGVLTKGPPVLLLVGGLALWTLCFDARRRRLLSLWPGLGLPLSLVPLGVWLAATVQADGGATARWLLDWYVLERVGGTALGQSGPPGTYLLTFALFLCPWFWLLPSGLVGAAQRASAGHGPSVGLVGWLAVAWGFYELVPSKLPAYALGAYPALALVMGQALVGLRRGEAAGAGFRLGVAVHAAVSGALVVALVACGWLALPDQVQAAPVVAAGPLAVVLALGLVALVRRRWADAAALHALAGVGLVMAVWGTALPALHARLFSPDLLAARVARIAPPDAVVWFPQSMRLPGVLVGLRRRGLDTWAFGEDARPAARHVVVGMSDRSAAPAAHAGAAVHTLDGWIPDKGQPVEFWIAVPVDGAP